MSRLLEQSVSPSEFMGCCQQRRVRFGDRCDLLSGLRVCWHGMTDADYHSCRKPITLVITAPSGSLLVEWIALQNSLCILSGSVLYFLYADPPSLSVNSAVNGTLPRLRALSGSDELLLDKAGRSCLLQKRMNYILLCLSSLSIRDKALLFWPPS